LSASQSSSAIMGARSPSFLKLAFNPWTHVVVAQQDLLSETKECLVNDSR
jgi:hypothetical protein